MSIQCHQRTSSGCLNVRSNFKLLSKIKIENNCYITLITTKRPGVIITYVLISWIRIFPSKLPLKMRPLSGLTARQLTIVQLVSIAVGLGDHFSSMAFSVGQRSTWPSSPLDTKKVPSSENSMARTPLRLWWSMRSRLLSEWVDEESNCAEIMLEGKLILTSREVPAMGPSSTVAPIFLFLACGRSSFPSVSRSIKTCCIEYTKSKQY